MSYGSAEGLSVTADWTAESDQVRAELSLAGTAGDVNGDGYSDVILGAPSHDNEEEYEGRAFVHYGSATATNEAPVANDLSIGTLQDTSVTITLTGSDADGDALTNSIVVDDPTSIPYLFLAVEKGRATRPHPVVSTDTPQPIPEKGSPFWCSNFKVGRQ